MIIKPLSGFKIASQVKKKLGGCDAVNFSELSFLQFYDVFIFKFG